MQKFNKFKQSIISMCLATILIAIMPFILGMQMQENISIYIYLLTASFMLNIFLIVRIILFSSEKYQHSFANQNQAQQKSNPTNQQQE